MKKNKLVSVIIPVYQVEQYLNRCLITVTQQTYSNLEIILVDDGSSDSSPLICDKWAKKDQRIKVIHKRNTGLADARNVGLHNANGDYIAFVDSDDWVSVNMIQKLVTNLENTCSDMAVCQFINVLPNGQMQRNTPFGKSPQTFNQHEFLKHLLEDDVITNHVWRKLYKRNVIPDNVFPKGKNFEDIYAMPYIVEKCKKIVCIDDAEYFYRFNEKSIVNNEQINTRFYAILHEINYIKQIEPTLTKKANEMLVLKELGIWRELISKRNNQIYKKKLKKYLCRAKWNNVPGYRNKFFLEIIKYCTPLDKLYYKIFLSTDSFFTKIKNHLRDFQIKRNLRKKLNVDIPIFIILGYPHYGNLGDRALAFGEERFIKIYFPEYKIVKVDMSEFFLLKKLKKFIKPNDIVGLQAGGNIGSLYPGIHKEQEKALANLNEKKVFIFPQTFLYNKGTEGNQLLVKTKKVYRTMNKFLIFVRDSSSYNFINQNMPFVNVELEPDMALMLANFNIYSKEELRDGALILLRNDSEQTLKDDEYDKVLQYLNQKFNHNLIQSDTHVYYDDLNNKKAKERLKNLFNKMLCKKLVVTDRLHGMIFAAITGTPCVVLKSKSPKIQGVYKWIEDCKYIELIENVNNLDKAVEKVLQVENKRIKTDKLNKEFNDMAEKIKEL